jgi:septal ring factor EnvC (AmiA/AmiB activator)
MLENNGQSDEEGNGGGSNEVEVLRRRNEDLERDIKSREEAVSRLETDLTTKNREIAGLTESRDGVVQEAEELRKTLAGTVAAYRELVVGSNPGVVADLISGSSVAEINESLKKAQTLMEKVRQGMEVEAAKTRVPAGAPARGQSELSGLTAREKIRYGIGKVVQG